MLLKGQGPCRQDPLETSAVLVRKTNMQHAPETVDEQYRTSLHLLQQQSAEGKSRYNGCCGDPFHPPPRTAHWSMNNRTRLMVPFRARRHRWLLKPLSSMPSSLRVAVFCWHQPPRAPIARPRTSTSVTLYISHILLTNGEYLFVLARFALCSV